MSTPLPTDRSRAGSRGDTRLNALLAALPRDVQEAFERQLAPLHLANGELLVGAGAPTQWVYFPDSAVVSVVAEMKNGAVAEAGTIGREGMTGLPVVFGVDRSPLKCFVQVAGNARRVSATAFRALLAEHAPLRELLLRYAHSYLCQVAQTAACNALHPIDERCARWLLMTDDRVGGDARVNGGAFELTQESLAYMLGVRREGVSTAARGLRDAGLIRFGRGRVTVLDRPGLEAAACECYGAVRTEAERVLGRSE